MSDGADQLALYLAALPPDTPVVVSLLFTDRTAAPKPEFAVLNSEIKVASNVVLPPQIVPVKYKTTAKLFVHRTPDASVESRAGLLELDALVQGDPTIVTNTAGKWVKIIVDPFAGYYVALPYLHPV